MNTLIAGIGNVLHGDDGFGSEVARRLAARDVPDGVTVTDYGIRGTHLALDLLEGCELLVLVDAMSRGDAPGTLYLFEPDPTGAGAGPLDAHQMDPRSVLAMVAELGGSVGRVLLVGCEPESLDEHLGLSDAVSAAVMPAITMIESLVA